VGSGSLNLIGDGSGSFDLIGDDSTTILIGDTGIPASGRV